MSLKAVAWALLAAAAIAGVLLLNYWAAYQPLSTLVYLGIVLALGGLANVAIPFRFLGIRRRIAGALVLSAGFTLALAGLYWPARTIHVAQHKTRLDDAMPEYQFNERHSARVHAGREQLMRAVREATFGDMRSLNALLRIRGAALHAGSDNGAFASDKRILDAFSASGYLSGGNEHEIVMIGVVDVRARRLAEVRTLEEAAAFRAKDAVKMAFDFEVEEAGAGWSRITTETRVLALDDSGRGMAKYWRLIVPGSGLLRLQWLDGIKRRAESMPATGS